MITMGVNPHWVGGLASTAGGSVSGEVGVSSSNTGITGTNATGAGQAFSVVPPAMAINYLIKN